ncbi:MAG: CPBP family intramembrane metalloprotease [Sedimentisphaerales bacterium]|nr:CPBP family intramembrane metalloprotease [Sedimentisphaerales bacterium]
MEPVLEIIQYIWIFSSLVIFIVWLRGMGWGRRAFEGAVQRQGWIEVVDVVFMVVLYLGMIGVVYYVSPADYETAPWGELQRSFLFLGGGQLILVFVLLVFGKIRFTDGLRGFGMNLKEGAKIPRLAVMYSLVISGLTLLALLLTLLACDYFGYKETYRHEFLDLLDQDPPVGGLVILIVMPVVIAPLMEELMFRGLIQNFIVFTFAALRKGYHPLGVSDQTIIVDTGDLSPARRWLAIFIATVPWALMHGWQHWPALMVLGMGLGYCYERYGSLLIPIAVHSLFNGMQVGMTILQSRTG